MDSDKTKDILKTALRQAGEVLLQHYGKPGTVRLKESISSVVTEADIASEKVIIEILDKVQKPFNIITEESGFMDRYSAHTWLIIREAGGIVTDISGKEIDFDLSAGSLDRNYTIVASGTAIHAQLMTIINQK